MVRRWALVVPLVAALAGTVALPAAAAPTTPGVSQAACTADTAAVKTLTGSVNNIGSVLLPTPDPTKLTPLLGDLFNSVLGAQQAGCLPSLPVSAPVSTKVATDPSACLGAVLQLLTGTLSTLTAAIAVPPDPTAVINALTNLVTAVKSINTNNCLPVQLPVPGLPSLPV